MKVEFGHARVIGPERQMMQERKAGHGVRDSHKHSVPGPAGIPLHAFPRLSSGDGGKHNTHTQSGRETFGDKPIQAPPHANALTERADIRLPAETREHFTNDISTVTL